MSVGSIIKTALTKITGYTSSNVVDGVYNGTATNYITFNIMDSRCEVFSDNTPKLDTTAMQIHLFCPLNYDYYSDKTNIRKELVKSGFTYPIVTTMVETDTQKRHIVFECEIQENSEI